MLNRLQALVDRYEELTAEMARPELTSDYERLQALAKERASLGDIVSLYRRYLVTEQGIADARAVLEEAHDPEMEALAREEMERLGEQRQRLEDDIRRALLPPDPRDEKSVIVEIRAGTGGDEAALFAADLFRMYTRYAEATGWKAEVLSHSESGVGGLKEII
ncbi:MAG: PCRF domain-containing protein, partial [Dehalococcoidia bacterium]|nr:PCRF domain-containing protein [Dehalococcoidia bacterium]